MARKRIGVLNMLPAKPVPGRPFPAAKAQFLRLKPRFCLRKGPNSGAKVTAGLTGLASGKAYYVRIFAENEPEPGVHKQTASNALSFETSGPPTPLTSLPTNRGEALRLLGYLTPNNTDLNEVQKVTVGGDPTGGTFTLTSGGQR